MTLFWLLVFAVSSAIDEPERLNLERPNAWTLLLLLAVALDLEAADSTPLLRRRW